MTSYCPHIESTLTCLMMISRARNQEQAEAVVENLLGKKPERLSDLVEMLADQMISDLVDLESGTDYVIAEFDDQSI